MKELSKVCIQCEGVYCKTSNKSMEHWSNRKYCSRKCYWESKKGKAIQHIDNSGKIAWNKGGEGKKMDKHPRWTSVLNACAGCGADIYVRHYKVLKNTLNFCNNKCYRKHISDNAITPKNKRLRTGGDWKKWREAVFMRDGYTCVLCGEKGGEIHPDHIKKFADYPDLRFDVDNGRTLCKPCHLLTDTWGNRKKQTENLIATNW